MERSQSSICAETSCRHPFGEPLPGQPLGSGLCLGGGDNMRPLSCYKEPNVLGGPEFQSGLRTKLTSVTNMQTVGTLEAEPAA